MYQSTLALWVRGNLFCKLRLQKARTGWRLERNKREKGREKGRDSPRQPHQ